MGRLIARRKQFTFAAAATKSSAFFIPAGASQIGFDFGIKAAATLTLERYVAGIKGDIATALLAPTTNVNWELFYTMQAAPADLLGTSPMQGGGTTTYFTASLANATVGAQGLPPGWYRLVASVAPGASTNYVVYAADSQANDA